MASIVDKCNIQTREMIVVDLPPKAQALVREWLDLRTDELESMRDTQNLGKLPPR